jgi:MarR family transcriptional regulator, organic hydroperoxide resistance regulator
MLPRRGPRPIDDLAASGCIVKPVMARTRTDALRPSGETLRFMQRMWKLVHALDVRSKRMAKLLGVTGPQRLVLRVVGQTSMISARDIAATLGIHPSTLTGVLTRLEAGGLLVRKVDPTDRRRARFRLTSAGRSVNRERKGTVEAAVRRALVRADQGTIDRTNVMLGLLVTELSRLD